MHTHVDIAQKHSLQLVEEATGLCGNYKRAFSLYSQCHNIYNKNCITEQEKSALGICSEHALPILTHQCPVVLLQDSIQEFFSYFDQKRTVKIHIIEMHISEWMSTYNAGFGANGRTGH